MYRSALQYLKNWLTDPNRKPLVIRGARQVGKTYLVQMLAKQEFKQFIEINFEIEPEIASYFEQKDPSKTIMLLEAHYRQKIEPGRALIFLDEIQKAPEVFARLRYFYEKLPDLHIIAAGSLLDFILKEHTFSMPVGRIEYLHLGPVSFSEFLLACNEDRLLNYLNSYTIKDNMPGALHQRLTDLFKIFLFVGGMPESVFVYTQTNRFEPVEKVKANILNTFSDDFNKYGDNINYQKILTVFQALPANTGKKIKYVNISRDYKASEIAGILQLFDLAKLCKPVYHSACRGIPLGASINRKKFKLLFLDVGLLLSATGLSVKDIELTKDLMLINSGSVCEQFAGQHLLYRQNFFHTPELHYWIREQPSSNAEVDYIITSGQHLIPIEVKAGKTGTLRSLQQFVIEHDSKIAVRFNLDKPSMTVSKGQTTSRRKYSYPLLSLPLYMVEQVQRLVLEHSSKPCFPGT